MFLLHLTKDQTGCLNFPLLELRIDNSMNDEAFTVANSF